ncbi:O-antigen ligase family protein [Natronospora cellulosivora (SeqCode)]
MKKIPIDYVIEPILFIYIISLYLLTYRPGLNMISNAIAALLISIIWANILLSKRKIVINKFLVLYFFFILSCLASALYAINQEVVIVWVRTLVLIFLLMISFINYIDSPKKLYNFMRSYALSGFIASVYILLNSDFTQISRLGGDLGNVNTIGMIIGISSAFCFFFILEEKKFLYLPILLVNIMIIMLTGSRKALLFVIIIIVIMMYSKNVIGKGRRIQAIIAILLIVIVFYYTVSNVPFLYQVMGRRINNLFDFVFGDGTTEGSMNTRYHMISLGLSWFKDRPLTGYGINNYRFLYGNITGWYTYSHNNIVELLVGVGFLGTIIYYLTNLIPIIKLLKNKNSSYSMINYTFLSIIIGYLLMSVSLIYYYDKHISIILSVACVIERIYKTNKK